MDNDGQSERDCTEHERTRTRQTGAQKQTVSDTSSSASAKPVYQDDDDDDDERRDPYVRAHRPDQTAGAASRHTAGGCSAEAEPDPANQHEERDAPCRAATALTAAMTPCANWLLHRFLKSRHGHMSAAMAVAASATLAVIFMPTGKMTMHATWWSMRLFGAQITRRRPNLFIARQALDNLLSVVGGRIINGPPAKWHQQLLQIGFGKIVQVV